jgi:hypothetical protein
MQSGTALGLALAAVSTGLFHLCVRAGFIQGPAQKQQQQQQEQQQQQQLTQQSTSLIETIHGARLHLDREWKLSSSSAQLLNTMRERYGSSAEILRDRLDVYEAVLRLVGSVDCPTTLVASPGRDRLFMGHTDFAGLGGFTVDSATREEIVAGVSLTDDGLVTLENADERFPNTTFSIYECIDTAKNKSLYGTKVWDSTLWSSYVKGALAYMLSDMFVASRAVREGLGVPESYFTQGKGRGRERAVRGWEGRREVDQG